VPAARETIDAARPHLRDAREAMVEDLCATCWEGFPQRRTPHPSSPAHIDEPGEVKDHRSRNISKTTDFCACEAAVKIARLSFFSA
jgi:hypothetical protein